MSAERDTDGVLSKVSKTGQVSLRQKHMNVTINSSELHRAVKALDTMVDRCRMHFEAGRIRLEGLDPATVTAVNAEVTDIDWQTDMERLVIGVQTDALLSGIWSPPPGDELELRIDSDEDQIKVLKGPLMDYVPVETPATIRDQPDTSSWEHPTTAEVDAMKFKGAVGAVSCAASFGVRMTVDDDSLTAESKDWETNEYEHSWTIPADTNGVRGQNLFSEGYLGNITDAIDPTGTVRVYLSEEYPVRIATENVEFLLAPRIQADSQEDL